MKIVAVIPAHLASIRFPRKILCDIHGIPMIEHVRRRALLSDVFSDVFVATCDQEIAEVVNGYGGQVLRTASTHTNGTSRVAEAIEDIDCSHVVLLQGDEPLLLPRHLEQLINEIKADTTVDAWNATGPITHVEELDRHSFVKCLISRSSKIVMCFRRTPCHSDFEDQAVFVRKILGLIAYRKRFLQKVSLIPPSPFEQAELIEQMRIIEANGDFRSIPVSPSLPSINEPEELQVVLGFIEKSREQLSLLNKILE
jgi:3-deoxy-manno-octulosonate cytidylyltransferase (CMP-KDO synthetase)